LRWDFALFDYLFLFFIYLFNFLRLGKKTVFMGDDTWTALYPDAFTEQYPFPSLVVKDIHTVDNGVIQYLFPVLQGLSRFSLFSLLKYCVFFLVRFFFLFCYSFFSFFSFFVCFSDGQ
jgi:hypothetical protein